jgi:hypothetical protein
MARQPCPVKPQDSDWDKLSQITGEMDEFKGIDLASMAEEKRRCRLTMPRIPMVLVRL